MFVAKSIRAASITWIRNLVPFADSFWMMLLLRLFNVHFILQIKILTLGLSCKVALSAYFVTSICVEQRTPGRSKLSSTFTDSYVILLDGNTMEYPLFEVNVMVFSRLIGNCFTDVSRSETAVVVVVADGAVVVLEI